MIDAHVYCLPSRLRDSEVVLPQSEGLISSSIHRHPEGSYALGLSSPEAIKSSMEKHNIEESVLVAFPWASQELCRENNDYLLEVAAKDNCFKTLCAVQPSGKQWIKEAERCLKEGALGIKVNPVWQGYELDGPEMDNLADFIEKNNAFLMVHVDQFFKKSSASPAHLYSFARKHPETRILAAHLGGLVGIYALHPPVAEALRNVWFDTAVSSTVRVVCSIIQSGLQDRIIFGSDFPFNHSHSQGQVVKEIKNLRLKPEIEKAIFNDNFFNLIRHPRE